ncbi:MAG: Holliday junction DNA helicase RuvA [Candidatus Melainabacteria bacterium GWF2_37_15]|nr:MAG: Holliday junction DNA helicase RuvA [Candidatus Melainabacteria bacterium GWF2_37_15]
MINYLKGQLISKVEDSPTGCNITVEVNNIGYLIFTNKRVIASLPNEGENVTIYTSLIHREDSMSLCGFDSREDRDLFNLLITVSGVGTKAALAIMGELSAYGVVNAVLTHDDKAISKAKGVGPKLAAKIILELKDKMTGWRTRVPAKVADSVITPETEEAETVLLSLGYTKNEVSEALKRTPNKNDTEEIIRIALQWLAAQ